MIAATNRPTAALSIKDFCATFGVGRTTAYAEIAAGRLTARKLGARTLIMARDAQRWADSLPKMHGAKADAA